VMTGAKSEALGGGEDPFAANGDAVLIMRPMTLEQINHVAELGQTLPSGSSAFHPRLAGNLVTAVIDPDEDLV
jgi:hypothetical protein